MLKSSICKALLAALSIVGWWQSSTNAQTSRPTAPAGRVLFVYDASAPKDSLQNKVYLDGPSLSIREFQAFQRTLEEIAPQYRSYLKDVESSTETADPQQLVKRLIDREINRVNELPRLDLSAGSRNSQSRETVSNNGVNPAVLRQRLGVTNGLLSNFKIYDASGNRIESIPTSNYSSAIPSELANFPVVSPETAAQQKYQAELMQSKNQQRDAQWNKDQLRPTLNQLNARSGELQERKQANQERENRVRQIETALQQALVDRDRYLRSLQFDVSVLGQTRTYTYATDPWAFESDSGIRQHNARIQELERSLTLEKSRVIQSDNSQEELQRRLQNEQQQVQNRINQADREHRQAIEQEQRIKHEINKQLNSKGYGDHD